MSLKLLPMTETDLDKVVKVLNRGFSDYAVPVQFSTPNLLRFLVQDSVSLVNSRIALVGGEFAGVALIARRGWSSRLAAMAVVPEARGQGVGTRMVMGLMDEARGRGDRAIWLEVIEDNTPAVQLYRKCGFKTLRRLVEYIGAPPAPAPAAQHDAGALEEIDLRELARLVTMWGLPDLPWQISGETLALSGSPDRAYRLGDAFVAVSDPLQPIIQIRSLLVAPEARGRGQGVRILRAVMAAHPAEKWSVQPICPQEFDRLFREVGMEPGPLSQLQMVVEW
jgi:ribosomal protein S18 acetylase RimI-like enzyme